MARVKPKNSITSRESAERAMGVIDNIDRQFAEWDLHEAKAVAEVRGLFIQTREENNYVGMEAQRSLLIKELKAWAEGDCSNWDKKTVETPFGCFGFRTATPSVALVKRVAGSFKAALALLEKNLPAFVREVKEVNKEGILAAYAAKSLDTDKLLTAGLEVKHEDEFWVESSASKDLEDAAKKLRAA